MTLQAEDVLDYYELEAELKKMEALATPSEAHGILCGQVSGGLPIEGFEWLKAFLPMVGAKTAPNTEAQQWLCLLYGYTIDELEDNQLNFMPLLPDDEDPLIARLGSLAEWCSGFLAGFGTSGSRKVEDFNEEVLDALRDIQQISQVDSEIEEEEEGEAAYFEVLEYVRMAALMIFTEFAMTRAPIDADKIPPGTTIH